MTPREAAVSDAGPLIHLDELAVLDVLSCYRTVWVPAAVAVEVDRYRTGWRQRAPDVVTVIEVGASLVVALRQRITCELDPGELEAPAFWDTRRDGMWYYGPRPRSAAGG